jgi:hypothetical protein
MRRIEGKPGERAARPRGVAFLNGRTLDASPVGWANFIEILIVLYRLFRLSASSGDSGPPRTAAAVRDASGSNVEIVRMRNRCVNTNENDSQQYYWGVIGIFTSARFLLPICYL